MQRNVGIWLDHRHATVVLVRGRHVETQDVYSQAEPRVRSTGGTRCGAGVPGDIVSESRRDARIARQLDRYYDELMRVIAGADRIHVCGPGEAKRELSKRIAADRELASRLETVEPCDKLTRGQFVAMIREVFGVPVKRAARA
jgi:hypothetical protein